MRYLILQSPANSLPAISKDSVEGTSITIGFVALVATIVGILFSAVKHIAEISANANQLKNDFEKSDLLINNKIDKIGEKLDNAIRLEEQYQNNISRRISINERRISDMEMFLNKQWDFAIRRFNQVDDDNPPSGFQ